MAVTTEQIIIEFVADASQIEGVIPILQKIGNLSQADADALKKISSQTNATTRASDTAGVKLNKTLKDVEKGAKKMAETFEENFKNGIADALTEAGVTMEDFVTALKQAGMTLDDVKEGAVNLTRESKDLKAELRETSEVMAVLVSLGKRNSDEYEALAAKAAELKKSIGDANKDVKDFGSDTRGLDKVLMATRGIAGGFAVAQGAAALLGDENEELQKSILKVNAAMSILQGLKEIQELANTREFASLTTLIGAKKLETLQTNLQAGAESKNIVVRYAAAAAQKVLNAAMAISPIGLILAGITAIALAYKLFSDNAQKAVDAQHKLNLEFDEQLKYNDLFVEAIQKSGEERVAALKSNNAQAAAIRAEELRTLTEQQKQISAVEQSRVTAYEAATARLRSARNDANEDQVKEDQATVQKYEAIQTQKYDIERQIQLKILENEDLSRKERLKNETAFADAKVLAQREGSRKELVAQIAAIQAREKEELESAAHLPGEVAKIRAQAQREISGVNNQIKIFDLNEELAVINAKLALSKKGSADEFNLHLSSIKKQHEIDLANKSLTDNQKYQLEQEYIRKVEDLQKEYNRRVQEEAINTQQSITNAKLADLTRANVNENNAEVLKLKKEQIDQQTSLEVVAAQNTITNETQLAARLKEIWAKNTADKNAINEAAKLREVQYDYEITNIIIENAKKRTEVDMASGDFSKRIAARKNYQRLLKQSIDEEEAYYDRMWEEGLITYEEWNKKMLDIQGKRIDQELAAEQEKEDKRKEITSASFGVLQSGLDAVFEIGAQRRQAELDDTLAKLSKQHDAEISNKNLSEEQKAAIDERYRVKEAAAKKAAYMRDRQSRIAQAVMNGLLAATNALATVQPFWAAIVAAAGAAATTAINVAKIKSEPIPAFKTGTKSAPKGYALVGEEGPELVRLSGGERIWSYRQSEKIQDAWRGGSVLTPDQILSNHAPKADHELMGNFTVNQNGRIDIDYDQIGKSVAKHAKEYEPVEVHNSIDEDGLNTFITKKGNRTKILNKYYKVN